MINDTISSLITKIRNAIQAKHKFVEVPLTKMSKAIIKIFKEEGFIKDYTELEKTIYILFKYVGKNKKSSINELKRISKPGLRVYTNIKGMPMTLGNLGISIISTSKGVMTNHSALKKKIGGEILCYIY
jgi:small subunit ribosomal protein S8